MSESQPSSAFAAAQQAAAAARATAAPTTVPTAAPVAAVPEIKIPTQRVFHNLSAGSTTILPSGKVISFGGKVERVEGGTKVGRGSYSTADPEEISWLASLCKAPSPQVWEELPDPEKVTEVPAVVTAGLPAAVKQVTDELQTSAVVATSAEVTAAIQNAPKTAAGQPAK